MTELTPLTMADYRADFPDRFKIDPAYGNRVVLYCLNHPTMRWHTKNIDYIGARHIFFIPTSIHPQECDCRLGTLRVLPLVAM